MIGETIYTLFKEFLEEGQAVLKVPECERLSVVNGIGLIDGKIDPIFVNWAQKKAYLCTPFFEIQFYDKDAPTPIRLLAYQLANRWRRSLIVGRLCDIDSLDDISVAYAIASIKGLQLFITKKFDFILPQVKKRIFEFSGLSTDIRIAQRVDGKFQRTLCMTDDKANKKYIDHLDSLIKNECVTAKPLSTYKSGDKGSKENPFENVHEAANYILFIEAKRLQNDRFRTHILSQPFYYDFASRIFRIPWASPYVSYLDGPGVVNNGFVVNQLVSGRFSLKPNLVGRKFLFRGQSEFFAPCVPSMFRNPKDSYFLKYNIFNNEMTLLLQSHPLVQLFKNGINIFNERFVFEVNYGGLNQHYYNKTQYLDLTSNIEAAKFFAVTYFDFDNNKYQPFHKDGLGVLYYYDIEPDAFTDKYSPYYRLSAIGKQPFMRSGAQHGYLLAMAKDVDFNHIPQVRYVFFKHNKDITDEIYEKSNSGEIYMSEDILQHYWYDKLTDPNRKNRVSMEAVQENHKYNSSTPIDTLLKQLSDEGISIYDGIPAFSKEELDKYYFRNALQNWEQFCKDIYFYGSEGHILKKHLVNLPNDVNYHKYFYL